jgi:hypothetical protein
VVRLLRFLLLATTLALAACGEKVLNTDELEGQIATELEAQTGLAPTSVDCPADVPAKKGSTFRCTVTADDGSSAGITVTQTDDDGSIDWEVDS